MAVPRLAIVLIAGVLLIPAVFVMSRMAAGSGESPPPGAAKASAKPETPAQPKASASKPDPKAQDPVVQARKQAAGAGLPASVALALAKGQTVVLLLTDGKSADDRSTTNAVRSLKGKAPKALIVTDRLKNLGSYRAIVSRVGVTQSPSVVILSGSKARVVEGYVDPETLLQQVLDARR